MQKQLCSQKSEYYYAWATLREACLHWVTVILCLLLGTFERVPAFKQLLNFFGGRVLCNATVHPPQTKQTHFLPPEDIRHLNKLTVVLDLDETLVCAYESSGLPPFLHMQASQTGVKWFQLQCTAVDKDEGKSKISHVIVYERPGLREFLEKTSEFAELIIFTAGLEAYASPLIDEIDPERRISARLYRPSTVTTKCREHVKDLSCLGRDLQRTVIIDNNPFSFVLQPSNGIPCIPFTGYNADDRQLPEVLLPLLQHLSTLEDIRPALDDKFHMSAWFRDRGIPGSNSPS